MAESTEQIQTLMMCDGYPIADSDVEDFYQRYKDEGLFASLMSSSCSASVLG